MLAFRRIIRFPRLFSTEGVLSTLNIHNTSLSLMSDPSYEGSNPTQMGYATINISADVFRMVYPPTSTDELSITQPILKYKYLLQLFLEIISF